MKFKVLKAVKLADELIMPGAEIDYANLGEAKKLVQAKILEPISKVDLDKLNGTANEVVEPIKIQLEKAKANK